MSVGDFVRRNVYGCVTSIVEFVLKYPEESSDILNLNESIYLRKYEGFEGFYALFSGGFQHDLDKEIERLKLVKVNNIAEKVSLDQIEEEISVLENLESYEVEIYEWWMVSGFFSSLLEEECEVVIKDGLNNYWGRTLTGQAVSRDYKVKQIHKKFTDVY